FVSVAGNPVLSTPNGARLDRALAKLDFMVSIDAYINETTRHAHIILPPVHLFQRSHYDVVFHTLAVHNTAKFAPPIVPRPEGALDDSEILYELGMRLGGMRVTGTALDGALKVAWKLGKRLPVDRVLDLALRLGPYGAFRRRGGLTLARVAAAPHGIDLGALKVQPERVRGRVQLAPKSLRVDLARLERWITEDAPELVLIGRRHVRSNNSWMHNTESLVKGPSRSALMMHPADAKARNLTHGQKVEIESRVGRVI